ncbi:cell division protein FtsQ/DivIB [Melioribacteraceae bacterium 4301-Me]|uniref:cell division protein FtsQ/DivIB n=1 Tax=Pyranulibacter aquaticus TaxID=3163344 RepID=UPI003596C71C
MKKQVKIWSVLFLIIITSTLFYLFVNVGSDQNYAIEFIELIGNNHLSKEQYLEFANLTDKKNYKDITLQIIKDRFQKHPYIASVDVKYDAYNKVSVFINEKNFESILMKDSTQYLLTDELQVIPILNGTRRIDYPVISNPQQLDEIKLFSTLKNNNDVLIASKIISAVKLLNPGMYDELSEINMRRGGDILMLFSSLQFPVVIGRSNEIKKVAYLNSLWNNINIDNLKDYLEYLDLRFNGHIYLGVKSDYLSTGGNKS